MSVTSQPVVSPQTQPRFFSAWFLLIGANILWATSYVVGKYALEGTSVTMMLALRMLLSAGILLPFLIFKRGSLRLTWRDVPQLALLSFVGFVLNKLLEFWGLHLTTASDVALLITGESIFTAILSWLILREAVRRRSIIALVIGFFGVYLIVGQGLIPRLPEGGVWRIVGNLLVLVGLLVEAFYSVRGKVLLEKHSTFLITAASIVGSVVFWAPVAGGEFILTGGQMPGLVSWLAIAWLALFCTVLPYLAWFRALEKIDGSLASASLFIQPLLGTALAIIFLHEQLTWSTIIGGVLIIVSVYLISR